MKKIIVSIVAVSMMLLLVPMAAVADTVSWTSGTYRAYSYAKVYEDSDIYFEDVQENFSPPQSLPVSASAYAEDWAGYRNYIVWGDASSTASNASFNTAIDAVSF